MIDWLINFSQFDEEDEDLREKALFGVSFVGLTSQGNGDWRVMQEAANRLQEVSVHHPQSYSSFAATIGRVRLSDREFPSAMIQELQSEILYWMSQPYEWRSYDLIDSLRHFRKDPLVELLQQMSDTGGEIGRLAREIAEQLDDYIGISAVKFTSDTDPLLDESEQESIVGSY